MIPHYNPSTTIIKQRHISEIISMFTQRFLAQYLNSSTMHYQAIYTKECTMKESIGNNKGIINYFGVSKLETFSQEQIINEI